jgi:predicted outer membrane lipoprotein
MLAATSEFSEYGILGLVIIICFGVIAALWKHLHKERDAHSVCMKEVQEENRSAIKDAQVHYAKERDAMREKFDNRLEALTLNVEKYSTETLNKVIELTRGVSATTEGVKTVVSENSRVIEHCVSRVDAMGEKILLLGERVDKMETK